MFEKLIANGSLKVYDRQANGSLPASFDILADYDNAGVQVSTASRQAYSGMNMNNRKRFTVLRDKRIRVLNNSPTSATIVGISAVQTKDETEIDWYVKLAGLQTCYKSSTNPGSVGDISSGALYIVGIGNLAPGTEVYGYKICARLKFVDA